MILCLSERVSEGDAEFQGFCRRWNNWEGQGRHCRFRGGGAVLLHAGSRVAPRGLRVFGLCWISGPDTAFGAGGLSCYHGVRAMAAQKASVVLETTITCPACGHSQTETMPTDACQWFYDCRHCGAVLKPKPGDCCVFCSYATVPCPPVQVGTAER